MLPFKFPQTNYTFTKPESMTDEQCMDLPVFGGLRTDGFPQIISCWKLSKEDLEEINKTGCIWLEVVSNQMPPVALFTENPFEPKQDS